MFQPDCVNVAAMYLAVSILHQKPASNPSRLLM